MCAYTQQKYVSIGRMDEGCIETSWNSEIGEDWKQTKYIGSVKYGMVLLGGFYTQVKSRV